MLFAMWRSPSLVAVSNDISGRELALFSMTRNSATVFLPVTVLWIGAVNFPFSLIGFLIHMRRGCCWQVRLQWEYCLLLLFSQIVLGP